jgi:hypothetical protein
MTTALSLAAGPIIGWTALQVHCKIRERSA